MMAVIIPNKATKKLVSNLIPKPQISLPATGLYKNISIFPMLKNTV